MQGNFALPEQFQKSIYDYTAAQNLISDILIYYRKRDAARSAVLFIIARYGEGDLAVFNRDMIRFIAKEVWKTREEDIWLDARDPLNVSSSKRTRNV